MATLARDTARHGAVHPRRLVEQAVATERAGFDALRVSDHYQPWWEPGESAHAWVLLGAIGQATERVPVGTGVTAPVHRHHPGVTAQPFMRLKALLPGRAFLGIGSGESLNKTPCGMRWPEVGEQVSRMEEALEIIDSLFAGERLSYEGTYFRTERPLLHTRAELPRRSTSPRSGRARPRWPRASATGRGRSATPRWRPRSSTRTARPAKTRARSQES